VARIRDPICCKRISGFHPAQPFSAANREGPHRGILSHSPMRARMTQMRRNRSSVVLLRIGLDQLPQSDDCDLAAAVKPQRNVSGTETSTGIANQVPLSPQTDASMPAAQQMCDYRSTARQAYLPTMGVATKVKSVSRR